MYEAEERSQDALSVDEGDKEEEIAAAAATDANTSMLLDFVEVMKAGVFVQARSSFGREVSEWVVAMAAFGSFFRGRSLQFFLEGGLVSVILKIHQRRNAHLKTGKGLEEDMCCIFLQKGFPFNPTEALKHLQYRSANKKVAA